jgi:nucleoside-diphosphate-sugar epimerase
VKKILITGAKGTIGSILCQELTEYSITSVDLPEYDIRNYEVLKKLAEGRDAIVHLAWNTQVVYA